MYNFQALSRLPITLAIFATACLAPLSVVSAAQPSPEIVVAPEAAPQKNASRTATDANGNFVVVWTNRTAFEQSGSILAQRYDRTGVLRGSVFTVATGSGLGSIDVAMDASGRFFVVWVAVVSGPIGLTRSVHGRRFDGAGVAEGNEFVIDSAQQSNGGQGVRVAMNSGGASAVVWDERSLLQLPPFGFNYVMTTTVKLLRFNAQGQRSGLVQTVASSTAYFTPPASSSAADFSPGVAINNSGRVVVAWSHESPRGDWVVNARRYGPLGAAQGAAFQATSDARFPASPFSYSKAGNDVVLDDAGLFTLAWTGSAYVAADQSSIRGVFKRRFGADGQPLEDEVLVAPRLQNPYTGEIRLGLDGSSNPVLAWVTLVTDADGFPVSATVDAQRFDSNGAASGAPIRLNTRAEQLIGSLSLSPQTGNGFLAGWVAGRAPYLSQFANSAIGDAKVVLCCASGN